jgi:ubiquinone/menaquinone biosynthesis C-methylase UbiE
MSTEFVLGRDFQRIDDTHAAEAFVRCLDVQHGLEATLAWKRRACALMQLSEGSEAVDVGCGTGEDARALAGLVGAAGRVVGIDKSAAMIAEARKRNADAATRMEFHEGDAASLPLPDASVDAAHTERVLVHAPDPGAVVAEMARVVRPGGRVVVTEPDMETFLVNADDRKLTRRIFNYICDNFPSGCVGRRLPGLFRDAGLADLSVVPEVQFVTDPAVGRELFGLERSVAGAKAAGAIDEGEAAAFLANIEEVAARGHFAGSCTLFTVAGTRP